MNAENTKDFTIILGREFGLSCNLKCGPGLRPFGTIHFENRRNRTDEYDSSNELCNTLKRKSSLLARREECIFTTQEIEMLYHFVWFHFDVIKAYIKEYITSKGFIPAMFPKIYTEESIVAECQKMSPDFIKVENFIAKHNDLHGCDFANLKNKIDFYNNQFNTDFCKESVPNHIQKWVNHNTDDYIRGINESYIKKLYRKLEKK